MTKTPYHQVVAEEIIKQLKEGQAPWVKPWEAGNANGLIPHNPVTGKRYRGINALYLMMKGSDDNRWLTYKQAQSIDAQVRKGEKGTTIQYWKFSEERIKKDEQGLPVKDKNGEPVKVQVNLERPKVFYATVFHASQIDNMPELAIKKPEWDSLEKAESILQRSGATLFHSEADRAFYRQSTDSIHLPPKNQFKSAALYYATALHELGHWTGHESRLNRDLGHPFGSEGYAREELRAEIASMLMGDELGIGHDPSQHTAYIKSWISVLEDDPLEIFRAASDAEKITTHVIGLEHKQELTYEITTKEEQANEQDTMQTQKASDDTIYLNVPFHQKEKVKALAGKLENGQNAIAWDKSAKKWVAKPGANLEVLKPWLDSTSANNDAMEDTGEIIQEKTYLAIPFKDKDIVKSLVGRLDDGQLGIGWDKVEKCWYAKPGVSLSKITPWLPVNQNPDDKPLSTVDEFKETLIHMGAILSGEHPIMDGQTHRIQAEGDKHGEKAIFYVAHLDGIPAGYIKNNRTGAELKWKSKGYTLSEEEKATLLATAAEKKRQREEEVEARHKSAALRLEQKLASMQEVDSPTPYMQTKGIQVYPGVYTDNEKLTTCIPAIDADGELWSMQYVSEDGTKRFAKGAKKEGCFHVVGGLENLAKAPVIIIAEGYATAATIKEAMDTPVVAAFDAGNLKPVAKALRDTHPDTLIIIAADNDKKLEITQGINPGKDKAQEAAKSVDGGVAIPVFIGKRTQQTLEYSDFNDVAKHSGIDSVKSQIKSAITRVSFRLRIKKDQEIVKVSQRNIVKHTQRYARG